MVVVWTNVSTTVVEVIIRVESTLKMTSAQFVGTSVTTQGVKLIFFSDSHLAPKFIKVVANSKKVGRHFERQTKPFFTLSSF